MKKKVASQSRKQESVAQLSLVMSMQQLVLPLVVGIESTKRGLLSFVHEMGMAALRELLEQDAESIAGRKGKRNAQRTHHHWGTTCTQLPLGGRHVTVERPRVRRKGGGEATLPMLAAFAATDTLPERVMEQILLGVSTRGYADSLEPVPDSVEVKGTSKSAASRALIAKTKQKLAQFATCSLSGVEIVAMFIDAIEIAGKATILALGVKSDGTKIPLGLALGSTENHVVAVDLLQSLITRGLNLDKPTLFVIDGGKGIRKALNDVLGDRAVVQRCQVHKMRNVRDHLPEARRAYVMRQLKQAYAASTVSTAKKTLQQLISWLESNGEDSAAASMREGLDETLTVIKLGLPPTLRRTFATTNPIENMNGSVRRVIRNVKRWNGEAMVARWVALGVANAARKFRRVKGHAQIPTLIAALRPTKLIAQSKVA